VMPEKLRRAQDAYTELGSVEGGGAGTIRYAMTVEDAVSDADLAIDFVPDELESKLEIFSLLDRMCPPRTVICTPTEAMSVTDLASCTYRAERCVGLKGGELLRSRFLSAEVEKDVVAAWLRMGVELKVVEDLEPVLVKNQ
jgi:3-hydroxybutyryl-CoA dehydrogenase